MSRTRHHLGQRKRKSWDVELWGKRPCSRNPATAENKRRCRRIERRNNLVKGKGGMFGGNEHERI